jgi:ribosomal protein L30/L7E
LPGERVDETILLQRKSVEQLRADRIIKRNSDKSQQSRDKYKQKVDIKRAKRLHTKRFVSAQTILQQAEKRVKNTRRFAKAGEKFDTRRRVRSQRGTDHMYDKARVAFVVRAKGNMIPEAVKDGFEQLGLKKIYTARLVRLTPKTHKLVLQLRPFSIVGYPTRDQMEQLLRARGAILIDGKRKYLTGNMIVEQALGEEYNVLTIEELADAIFDKAPKYGSLVDRVASFDLHPPRQLYAEKHRSVHAKREVMNPDSFATFLREQLEATPAAKKATATARAAASVKVAGTRREREE